MEIYLDNSATTRPYDDVIDIMMKVYREDYGNPSSKHYKGVDSEKYVKEAREIIAKSLKASSREILFTSGGTESDNTALIGCAMAGKRRGNHIITTKIEHPAILETTEYLKKQGFDITYLNVDKQGVVDLEQLKNSLTHETIIVSVMHTNNEIGSVQPLEEIGKIIKAFDKDILFHVDAVQGYGKFNIVPKKANIDLMSVSGHKIHGPKGIGFLYIKEGTKILPYIMGGGQQGGMRSGTENVPAIAGMAQAVKNIYENLEEDRQRMYELRDQVIDGVSSIEGVQINGMPERQGAPHIISISVKNVRAEVLLHSLEEKNIYVSSGSACASNKNTVSDTLRAIGLDKEYLDSTIRVSLSAFNTKEDIEALVSALKDIIPELRKYTRR
ncbi:MAG: cysteine desulfurase [Lachnospiraceae bacterium]|nr:cysteine desulfurase [Lachnospiraceae bacterium]